MREMKDTQRATVHIGYDGRVHKRFLGPLAKERFENEVRVLRYLDKKGCDFVPKVISCDHENLYLVTSNCGAIVESISDKKLKTLFVALEQYGVEHGDPFQRNVTYSPQLGRFCVIDFEFATIIETGEGLTIEDAKKQR